MHVFLLKLMMEYFINIIICIQMEGDERCLYYAMQQFGRRCCQMPEVAICFFQIAGEGYVQTIYLSTVFT
jgi:hypothetical protein